MAEDGEEELPVEVSPDGEVQRSGGGRVARAVPGEQAQSFGWLVGTNGPAKNPKIRQGKSRSSPPRRVIYIYLYIYNILSTQTECRRGRQLDLLLWRESERH